MNWMQMKIEATENKRVEIYASELASVDEKLAEEANARIECVKVAHILVKGGEQPKCQIPHDL